MKFLCGLKLFQNLKILPTQLLKLIDLGHQKDTCIMIWLIGQKNKMNECSINELKQVEISIKVRSIKSQPIKITSILYKTCPQSNDLGIKISCKNIWTNWMKTCIQEMLFIHRFIIWIEWLIMFWQFVWRTQQNLYFWWGCLSLLIFHLLFKVLKLGSLKRSFNRWIRIELLIFYVLMEFKKLSLHINFIILEWEKFWKDWSIVSLRRERNIFK